MNVRARTRLRRGVLSTAMAFALALAAPPIAPAHDVNTVAGHAAEDDVIHDAVTETRLSNDTVKESAAQSTAAAATVADDPGSVGQWGPLTDWPVVGIHVALLPNGKVLAWDAVGDRSYTSYSDHTFTRATVYDPATDTFTPDWVTGFDVFCAGLAHLTDGTVFLAGGNADQNSNGINKTHVFDYLTNIWTRGNDMAYARWYPSVTPLTDGEMLITSGRPAPLGSGAMNPEVRATNGSLRQLSGASIDLPYYPWMDVAPDGRVFDSGPDDALRELDPTGAGTWQSFGPRGDGINRTYGSHALYDVGRVLVAGGGPSTNDARTIDINGPTPQVSATSPMAFGRRQFNLTVLADGTVLATGGNSTGANLIDMNGGVYNAELWNPATGNWTTLAAEQVTRQYHSSALLLPDGRVLSSGGGICYDCDLVGYLAKNAQIFSPPYLFKNDGSGQLAPRPQISDAPNSVAHGATFQITTPAAASIAKVGLVKLGAVTHSNNMEQRYVPLSFTAGSGQLTASVPQNPSVTPPGFYMLFIVDTAGVPSVAKIMWVGDTTPPPAPPQPDQPPATTLTAPASGASFSSGATVNLAATASDIDGGVRKVEFFATNLASLGQDTKLGEDTTAPYTFTWNGAAAGTYALTARATDDRGVTATTPDRTMITVNANQLPTVALTQPANGASFTAPATVNLAATASDADGTVTIVEFFNGNTKLGDDTTAPYNFTWSGVAAGTYTVTARATDDLGGRTTSAPSTITVNPPGNQPPTATITSPADGTVFKWKANLTITITARATDADGSVTKVEFLDGTTLLGQTTGSGPSYSFTWKNVSAGSHTLRVRATDNAGAVTTSAPVGITVKKGG